MAQNQSREFSRINVVIPFAARRLPESERNRFQARPLLGVFPVNGLPGHVAEDEPVPAWAQVMNAKLDAILKALAARGDDGLTLPYVQVNLSGGGLSFLATERYTPGELLEIRMILPFVMSGGILICGEVVKVDSAQGGFLTGVRYVSLPEEIREMIINFVFHRERDILREKWQSGENA